VLCAVDGVLAGCFRISDTIKSESAEAILDMKSRGIKTVMLTGDSEASAAKTAKETKIDRYFAKLLPEDKLDKMKEIRSEYGAVMFVGDGINDAPVLAGADVSAAMGSGADAAIEAADIVIMNSEMDAVPQALKISEDTNRIAKQNIIFALAFKLAVMVLGIAGFANMWFAVFADSGVAMLCVLNSIRVLRKKY
jgi:Cd2+/Zn2+-exporting ATPase